MRMLVLGAGLQGSACAFDLLQDSNVEVRITDLHSDRLPPFLAAHVGKRLTPVQLDLRDAAAVIPQMEWAQAVMSAAPYYLNEQLASWAVDHNAHFCDLGGNTEIVFNQKKRHDDAVGRKLSVIPDCGVAPGMVNVLAQRGIDLLDVTDSVGMYVGGLPQDPQPPLGYQVVYSLEGVLDYYTTLSWVLRDGRRQQVKALSGLEAMEFPDSLGTLEAFHTAGGLSTMGFRYEGRIATMEYKTLRYPGHARIMEAIRDLGLLDSSPVTVKGVSVVPRDVAIAVMKPRLTRPDGRDILALRVIVRGVKDAQPRTLRWDLVDRFDSTNGISAMMRCTGYSLAITGLMQARGQVQPGVLTPDEAVPGAEYIAELRRRGISLQETVECG